jgi:hypothetical protein
MAVAIIETPPVPLRHFVPLWHRCAPRRLVERCPADDPLAGWKTWQKHLGRRKRPSAVALVAGKEPPLLWGWPLEWRRRDVAEAIKSPTSLAEMAAQDMAAMTSDLPFALQIVALANALPQLADELPGPTWWLLAEKLHDLAVEASQHHVHWPSEPRDVVRQQLLGGELPLALGCLFPEVRALRGLRKTARDTFSEGLIEVTDGQGLPHARLLSVLGPLLACWTRARWLGTSLKNGPWSRQAESQYQWLVRQALRLADVGGRFMLAPGAEGAPAWRKSLFTRALELAGDKGDVAAADEVLPRGVVRVHTAAGRKHLPDPSLNSDWSGIAVLAGGWSRKDVRLAVAFADDPLRIELCVGGERLIAGEWRCETTCDGERVQPVGEWEQLCWESGKRFDFLELGLELSHGLRLERQLLLGREDRVLYLSDIVVAADQLPRKLKHSISLPLGVAAEWVPEPETRDGVLFGRKLRAAVLPLALGEWRSDPRGGSLEEENGQLRLAQESRGRALCCPLFFDLDRKRAKLECTWRQLTVGESMEVVPADAAVGFRVQSGCEQWLFYRSLGPAGNRTVLGQNVAGEFSAGRFLDSGKYKEWIEIEPV